MLYLPLDKIVQQSGSVQRNAMPSNSNDQMVDRIANEVIEKLQRNGDRIQAERHDDKFS